VKTREAQAKEAHSLKRQIENNEENPIPRARGSLLRLLLLLLLHCPSDMGASQEPGYICHPLVGRPRATSYPFFFV